MKHFAKMQVGLEEIDSGSLAFSSPSLNFGRQAIGGWGYNVGVGLVG